jgi:bile acid:Na+ symporter, BASS family
MRHERPFPLSLLVTAVALLAAGLLAAALGRPALTGVGVVGALAALALSLRGTGFTFTVFIFAGVAAALFYPSAFISFRGYRLSNLIVPLIQIIMFGMGTTLSVADFARVLKMPKAVAIGIVLQFSVMPLTGFALTKLFGLQGEVAAGVILVGAAPGGVASNVITYLAGGNVPLSVTMTACSTLLSPVLTPFAMTQLAGQYVPISFTAMMWSIIQMIIVPIVAGLVVNRLFHAYLGWLNRVLPVVSMTAICVIIVIITSLSRDQLLAVALSLIAVVVLHNAIGFLLGYLGGRAAGLNETDARTTSIEVGLQNGGMASGLAISVLHSSDAGLAAAIFGPWMNVSGSVLASWWRQRPAGGPAAAPEAASGGSNESYSETPTR